MQHSTLKCNIHPSFSLSYPSNLSSFICSFPELDQPITRRSPFHAFSLPPSHPPPPPLCSSYLHNLLPLSQFIYSSPLIFHSHFFLHLTTSASLSLSPLPIPQDSLSFSPLLNYGTQTSHKMYMKTVSFLIFNHCTSKHEKSQRNATHEESQQNVATSSLQCEIHNGKCRLVFLRAEIFTADLK